MHRLPDLCQQLSGKRCTCDLFLEQTCWRAVVCRDRDDTVWRWSADRYARWTLANQPDLCRLPALDPSCRTFGALIRHQDQVKDPFSSVFSGIVLGDESFEAIT